MGQRRRTRSQGMESEEEQEGNGSEKNVDSSNSNSKASSSPTKKAATTKKRKSPRKTPTTVNGIKSNGKNDSGKKESSRSKRKRTLSSSSSSSSLDDEQEKVEKIEKTSKQQQEKEELSLKHKPKSAPKQKRMKPTVEGTAMQIHRCRFVDWVPDPVLAMAGNENGSKLAISRRGGSIEIWNFHGKGWHQSQFIPGQKGENDISNAVLCLGWMKNSDNSTALTKERLFGADMEGNVFEVDSIQEKKVHQQSSFGGAVWCMDTNNHPNLKENGHENGLIAFGCEDGRIRIFSKLGGYADGIDYLKMLRGSVEGRILALKWHPKEHETLYTGGMDGLIRKWNYRTGAIVLQLATESYGKTEPICIWSLLVLSDSTLFSGDSEGHIHVWDTHDQAGVLVKGFHEHRADVTTIVATKDEKRVFASGIDSRVAMFKWVKPDAEAGRPGEFVYAYSHRPHSHDVRGLAFVGNGRYLVSAGNDTQLCWYPVDNFSKSRPVKCSPFLHRKIVHVSENAQLMLVQHTFHLELWEPKKQKLAISLYFNGRHAIRCSALSKDGKYLACSDDRGFKLFRIQERLIEDDPTLTVKRIKISDQDLMIGNGVPVACCFSNVGKFIVVALQDATILVVRVAKNGKAATVAARLNQLSMAQDSCYREETDDDDVGDDDVDMLKSSSSPSFSSHVCGSIQRIEMSPDDQWVACGDSSGNIAVFSVDSQQRQSEVSKAALGGSLFTSFTFQPLADKAVLAVTTMDNRFHLFNVDSNAMEPWTLNNLDRIDPRVLNQNDRILGVTFDPKNPHTAFFWARSFVFKVCLDKEPHALAEHEVGSLRFNMLHKYRPIVHLESIGANQLMVLEAPWIKVMKTFQDPIFRKRFGVGS